MTKQDFIKTIPGLKKLSVIFAQSTRMPMVFCMDVTMDDYVCVYLEEEDALERARVLSEDKHPAFVVNCKEKEIFPFFAELRLIGVNAIRFVSAKANGAEEFFVQLTDFLKFPDINAIPVEKRPIENASLQLSMLYFMQEVRRPVELSEKKNLKELEEESSANLARSKFLIPLQEVKVEGEEQSKRAVMLLKNNNEEVFIPLFTDGAELRKFAKENKMPVSVCEFKMVAEMMKNGKATGIVVNPASCNVILNKMGVASLEKRFLQ